MAEDTTKVTMRADEYDRNAKVASDGRLWLGEDYAGENIEVAVRKVER